MFNNLAGATFDTNFDGSFVNVGNPVSSFNNAGTFTKSGGIGATTIGILFNNTGTVNVQTGTLALSAGGTSLGTFSPEAGGTVLFNGGNHTLDGATFAGDGVTELANGGTIVGAGTLTSTKLLRWSGGTMSGTGATILPVFMNCEN